MRQTITRTRIIIIGVVTIITLLTWFGADIYHKLSADRIAPDVQEQITPLTPKLDIQVLDQLEAKRTLPVAFPLLETSSPADSEP